MLVLGQAELEHRPRRMTSICTIGARILAGLNCDGHAELNKVLQFRHTPAYQHVRDDPPVYHPVNIIPRGPVLKNILQTGSI
jgi:hypothetical protein